jgi:hypothetical protein
MRVTAQHSVKSAIVENQRGLLVAAEQPEIGVGTVQLIGKLLSDLVVLHPGKARLTSTEAQESKLVVFAGLKLQSTPVRPVRDDALSELGNRQRPTQSRGVAG